MKLVVSILISVSLDTVQIGVESIHKETNYAQIKVTYVQFYQFN